MVSPQFDIETLVAKTKDLPTIPAAAIKVLHETDKSTCNAQSIAQLLMQDHALTTRVLRLANSAYYGLSRQVSDLQEAVVILGIRTVRNLALVAGSYPWMTREIKGYDLGPKALWVHSLGTAVGAQMAAKASRKTDADGAFLVALLHDLGKVVLAVWLEQRMGAMMKMAREKGVSFHEIERMAMGFDHGDVGAHLATKWNLPEPFINVMKFHHRPAEATSDVALVDCVHLGDYMTMSMGLGLGADGMRYEFDPGTLERLSLEPEQFEELLSNFVDEFERQQKLFEALG